MMSSSWSILALCIWKVLNTVLATLGCSRQHLVADLSNVSVDGGVEIFKHVCLNNFLHIVAGRSLMHKLRSVMI